MRKVWEKRDADSGSGRESVPTGDSDAVPAAFGAPEAAGAEAEASAGETEGAVNPLWWRVLAYLPEGPLYVDCATCLFWRGALVGAILAIGVALCL